MFWLRVNPQNVPSNMRLFLHSILAAAAGITIGFVLFPSEASLIGVFLIAIAQGTTVHALLERNRDEVWNQLISTFRANIRLASGLFVVFLGILFTYAASTLLVPVEQLLPLFDRQIGNFGGHSITDVAFDNFSGILLHNGLVAAACFLFSLLYQHGGMLLVLGWNASVWGVVFAYIARTAPDAGSTGPVVYFLKSFLCIFPHLFLEALAYVLVAMGGVFLSKALGKYKVDSSRFAQVGGAILRVVLTSMALLVLASAVEAVLAPTLVEWLF